MLDMLYTFTYTVYMTEWELSIYIYYMCVYIHSVYIHLHTVIMTLFLCTVHTDSNFLLTSKNTALPSGHKTNTHGQAQQHTDTHSHTRTHGHTWGLQPPSLAPVLWQFHPACKAAVATLHLTHPANSLVSAFGVASS